jgi:DNA-binding CsgD family transcriptional regulator
LCEAEIDELVNQYNAGHSLRELAAEHGIHPRTVAAHLARRGVPRRKASSKLNPNQIEDAIGRCRAGDSLATVAAALDVHPETVRRHLPRAGKAE